MSQEALATCAACGFRSNRIGIVAHIKAKHTGVEFLKHSDPGDARTPLQRAISALTRGFGRHA